MASRLEPFPSELNFHYRKIVFPAKEIPFPQRCGNKIPFTCKKFTTSTPANLFPQRCGNEYLHSRKNSNLFPQRCGNAPPPKKNSPKKFLQKPFSQRCGNAPPPKKNHLSKTVPATMRERTATQKKNLSQNRSRNAAGTDSIPKTITYSIQLPPRP
jgi:hypothetical protein